MSTVKPQCRKRLTVRDAQRERERDVEIERRGERDGEGEVVGRRREK